MNQDGKTLPLNYTDITSKELFACDPPKNIYHYTDFNGVSGIIESKSLWLTKLSYLNDKTELKFAINLFKSAVESNLVNIKDTEKKELLKLTAQNLQCFENTNICVASFCENGDLLSQWRSYGNNGSGVAIEFNAEVLQKLSNSGVMNLWKCVYSAHEQKLIIDGLIDILLRSYDIIYEYRKTNNNWEDTKKRLMGFFNTTFLRVAPVIKNGHFHEEKEWRIITVPRKITDNNWFSRVTNQRVSQYYKLNFEVLDQGKYEFINGVIVGPSREPWMVSDAIGVMLRREGFHIKHMCVSKIPFVHQ